MIRTLFKLFQTSRTNLSVFEKSVRAILSLPLSVASVVKLIVARGRARNRKITTFFGASLHNKCEDFIESTLFNFGIWEPDLTAYVHNSLKPGDTFVDVGANIGYFSFLASSIVSSTGKVIAIEASPRIFTLLQENIHLNPRSENIEALNVAVSETPKTVKFYSAPAGNHGWGTTLENRGFPLETEIEGFPLEELLKNEDLKSIRLIKMDIEGGEMRVLPGLGDFLTRLSDLTDFMVELTPGFWPDPKPSIEEVLAPFFENGFYAYQIQNSYWPWRYLWPFDVSRPKRIYGKIVPNRLGQIDLILSRTDQAEL